ncbi:cation:proton antiporter [Amaricoccus sp. W119]|uniref:cation:proton antiporter domain-containing protein n=1 Tax=Amaricoccus sp. W119 TaxID=3391833 RepID=UPI0039A416C7
MSIDFLLLAFVFLAAGVIAVPAAARLGLGSVLGYLIAGVAISPLLSALRVDLEEIQHFAEFGVVMMLFLVGMELRPMALWDMRGRLIGLGGLQVSATALLVMAAALALGQPWSVALGIGLVLAMSSTAIVLQTLDEKGLMGSDGGRASFSVLLFQDISVIPIIALVPLLALPELADTGAGVATEAEGHGAAAGILPRLAGWHAALATIVAIAGVVAGGIYLTRHVFRFIETAHLRELFVAATLLFVIGIALVMTMIGLSPALGAFIGGVVLANSEYRHELESDISPFRGLLLGLFFMTVGAAINFELMFADLGAILAMTLGLMAIKALVLLTLAWLFRLRGADRWLFGLGLAQAGEFGFVLLSLTLANNVIPREVAERLSLVVAMSMLLTPLLFIFHDRVILPRFRREEAREPDAIEEKGEVIIAGHGRFGGNVNRMLLAAGYKTTVLDYSSTQLEVLRAYGVRAFYGDATRPDLLEAAGIAEARMLVIAIDQREAATELVRYVTKTYPRVHVIARAHDDQHVYELWAAGCRDIIRETFDGSVRAGRSAYEALGMHPFEAETLTRAFVADARMFLRELAPLYDPDVPHHLNAPYRDRARELQAERDARLAARGTAFAARSDRAWSPPTARDREEAERAGLDSGGSDLGHSDRGVPDLGVPDLGGAAGDPRGRGSVPN